MAEKEGCRPSLTKVSANSCLWGTSLGLVICVVLSWWRGSFLGRRYQQSPGSRGGWRQFLQKLAPHRHSSADHLQGTQPRPMRLQCAEPWGGIPDPLRNQKSQPRKEGQVMLKPSCDPPSVLSCFRNGVHSWPLPQGSLLQLRGQFPVENHFFLKGTP